MNVRNRANPYHYPFAPIARKRVAAGLFARPPRLHRNRTVEISGISSIIDKPAKNHFFLFSFSSSQHLCQTAATQTLAIKIQNAMPAVAGDFKAAHKTRRLAHRLKGRGCFWIVKCFDVLADLVERWCWQSLAARTQPITITFQIIFSGLLIVEKCVDHKQQTAGCQFVK